MNRPSGFSLSAIIASKDAGPDSLLGLSAVSLRRLWLVVPALCALAYPSLLSLLSSGLVLVHGSPSPNGVDCLGQCHRVPDTGAGGDASQLCLWTSTRITASAGRSRELSCPKHCPFGVCHSVALCGLRKYRVLRSSSAFSGADCLVGVLGVGCHDSPARP